MLFSKSIQSTSSPMGVGVLLLVLMSVFPVAAEAQQSTPADGFYKIVVMDIHFTGKKRFNDWRKCIRCTTESMDNRRSNVHDIASHLQDLSNVSVIMEPVAEVWNRDEQISRIDPDVLVINYSSLKKQPDHDGEYDRIHLIMEAFGNKTPKLIIYGSQIADADLLQKDYCHFLNISVDECDKHVRVFEVESRQYNKNYPFPDSELLGKIKSSIRHFSSQ